MRMRKINETGMRMGDARRVNKGGPIKRSKLSIRHLSGVGLSAESVRRPADFSAFYEAP